MINIILISDDRDDLLGDYFLSCKSDITDFFDAHRNILDNLLIVVPSERCNQALIDFEVAKYNHSPFVFIAYSHGNERTLKCNGNSIVQAGLNTRGFLNSLFLTNSCLTGKILGEDLVVNGCTSFVGYNEEIFGFLSEQYKTVSINCENACIKSFFSENISISMAFERMKNYYSTQIDKYEALDPLFASMLVKSRESLVILGNKELKHEDLVL